MAVECGAACEGEGEGEGGAGGGFASKSSCHPCLEEKKKGKKITYRAPVSFLWQPEGYYRTLPFIMKGLQLTGSRTGWGEGRTACCIFPAHSWETDGRGMNE